MISAKGDRVLISDDKRRGGRKPAKSGKAKKKRGSDGLDSRVRIYKAAGSQIVKDVAWLMSVVNVEDKYIDTSSSAASANTWTYVLINPIAQGTTPNTRVGQSVKCVGIECRYNVYCNAASTAFQTVRMMIFVDHQPNAAAPGATDIYAASTLSARTVGYLDRFTILHERTFAFSPTGSNGIYTVAYIASQDWHEEFNLSNLGTVADITKNACYVGYLTDQGASQPIVSFNARYVYVDN